MLSYMKNYFRIFLALSTLFLTSNLTAQTDDALIAGKDYAIVETGTGKVRGYVHKSVFVYKGIPYARAERFMAPEKPKTWTDIRSSMTYGPVCPIDPTTTVNDIFEFPFHHNWGYMNENCQTLNVWTTGINDSRKRPVMVWFHGGGFAAGSSVELPSYDGENISRKGDVVLVSVNHRLNVLGFLDLSAYGEKYKYSANAGLLDLIAALQWVKENIARFGGDPDNVTIFGQSGGGGKVTSLMNAPAAKGLFQKAIVQSGSYLSAFLEQETARRVAAVLLEELHLQPGQVDSLQKIPYDQLSAASKKALSKVAAELKAQGKPVPGFGLSWTPVHEKEVLPYQPAEPEALALSRDIPLLVGSTKNEFTPFTPGPANLTMESLKPVLKQKYGEKADAFMAAVKSAYPETSSPSAYLDIDLSFRPGVTSQANLKAANGKAPVYTYIFAWQSPIMDGMFKAMHCMELPFVFNNVDKCEEMTGGGKQALSLAEKMSAAWVSFARTGNPSTKQLPDWPAYTEQNGAVMIFDVKCKLRNHPDKELLAIAAGK